jgi:hypothetical protein
LGSKINPKGPVEIRPRFGSIEIWRRNVFLAQYGDALEREARAAKERSGFGVKTDAKVLPQYDRRDASLTAAELRSRKISAALTPRQEALLAVRFSSDFDVGTSFTHQSPAKTLKSSNTASIILLTTGTTPTRHNFRKRIYTQISG